MNSEDIASQIDDIINALSEESKEKVSREELEKELIKFEEYGVPIEQAKLTLVKKYGGSLAFSENSSSERTLISDLEANARNVNLLARVVTINPKEVTVKGEPRKLFYGIIGDESGTIPFTSWTELDVEKDDVIEISNAYTREWQGAVRLNFGDRVGIKKTEKDKLPEAAFKAREAKVSELRPGIGTVDVKARILEVNERSTEINGEQRKIFSGIIADESGKAQFTAWHDFGLKKGEVFNISGGYVKSWKGIPQLTFDEKAIVKKLDKSKVPKIDSTFQKMPLHELVEKLGGLDIEVVGTIIEIRQGSGIVSRCPECKRTLQGKECSIHGEVKGFEDLRLKIVVDDGTGAVSSIINRELTEKLLGFSFEEIKKMTDETFIDEANEKLFAKNLSLKGNALGDDFGTTIIAQDVEMINFDNATEAEKIASELEGIL